MNIVVLDDERAFHGRDDVVHFTSVEATIEWFEQHLDEPFILFLDHDLGYSSASGSLVALESRPFAVYLMDQEFSPQVLDESTIYVHSMNPVGADWLVRQLQERFDVKRIPVPKELYVDESLYEGLQIID